MKSQRFDAGTLSSPKNLPNGFVRADAFLTRSGVFLYRNADGSVRRELRPDAEVFNEDSLDTLRLTSLTMGHPRKPVTVDNARSLSIGTVGQDVRQDGRRVRATITVNDGDSIAAMKRGTRQISCGYWCDLDMTPGVTEDGESYDAVQKNIVYNHVAVVDRGRAGPDVAARLDGWEGAESVAVMVADQDDNCDDRSQNVVVDEIKTSPGADGADRKDEGKNMKRKITLDGVPYEFEADDTAFQAISKAINVGNTRADEIQAKMDSESEEHQKALDAEKARADAAEEKAADAEKKLAEVGSPEAFRARLDARLELERSAGEILGDEFKSDASDEDLRKAVIAKVSDVALEGKSDAYVEARYDAAVETFKKNAEAGKKAKESVAKSRAAALTSDGGEEDLIAKAKAKAKERNDALWKEPLAVSKDRAPENISVSG